MAMTPVFNQQQLKQMEQLMMSAPLLYPQGIFAPRPAWLQEEEEKHQRQVAEEENRLKKTQKNEERMRRQAQEMTNMQDYKRRMMSQRIDQLEEENRKLRSELIAERRMLSSSWYGAPEEMMPKRSIKEAAETTQEHRKSVKTPGGEDEAWSRPAQKEEPEEGKFHMMMEGMMELMEGMQMMQRQVLEVKKVKDMEVVRNSVMELLRLPEWKAETAPLT